MNMISNLHAFSLLNSAVRADLEQLHMLVSQLGEDKHTVFADEIFHILQMLSENAFKILVVGEFSSGKSTFLNALLGKKMLPTETTETTAAINIIKYGEKPTAIVHFRSGKDKSDSEVSPQRTQLIGLEQLAKYITSLTKESNEIAKTVKFVELFVPSKYCKNGVELVDTPGLNTTYEYHEVTTLEYLQNGHFGIMLLNGTQFLTKSEKLYLERFKTYMNKVMFVVNYVNQMPPDDSFEDNRVYFQNKLKKNLASDREIVLYPINALLAEQGDIANSGLDHFLRDFEAFLTSDEKAKEMLFPPIIQASIIIKTLIKNNTLTINGLSFSAVEFEKRISQLLPQKRLIVSKQRELLDYLDQKRDLLMQQYVGFAEEQYHKKALQIKKEIMEWTGDLGSFAEDLPDYLKKQMIESGTAIHEFVHEEIRSILIQVKTRYNDLISEISGYQDELAHCFDESSAFNSIKFSGMNEFGEINDNYGEFAVQLGSSFTIGYLSGLFLGPIGWVVAMVSSGFFTKFIEEKMQRRKQSELAQHVFEQITQMFQESIPKGAKSIKMALVAERTAIDNKLQAQLDSINKTIDFIKLESRQEEKKIIEKKKFYQVFNEKLVEIQSHLNNAKTQLAEG